MRIRMFKREFAPSMLMTFIALVSFVLFSALGGWQLQRAELKREIQTRYQGQLSEPYQFAMLDTQVNPLMRYKKVEIEGHFKPQYTLLLDNQVYRQQVGYHVLVPFFISDRRAVLVNRGWISAGDDRSVLPQIKVPKQKNRVKGIVTIPSNKGFRIGEVALTTEWPQRIPYIDLQKIQQGVDFELLPYVIWQAPEMDDYYPREWRPIWSTPEKSEAYALQWFGFAVITLILFIALNLKKT